MEFKNKYNFYYITPLKYYLNKYLDITPGEECFLKKYNRDIDDYYKLLDFLFENPKYIYQDFNYNIYSINQSYFILYNIHHIFQEDKIKYRENLIIFYAGKFFDIYDNNKIMDYELYWCLFNLQLLITKYISTITVEYKDYHISFDFLFRYHLEKSIISFDDFIKIIDKIYMDTKKNKNEFIKYLIDNKGNFIKPIEILLSKYFNDYTLNDTENIIVIGTDTYKRIELDKLKNDIGKKHVMEKQYGQYGSYVYYKPYYNEITFINDEDILLLNINNTELLIINNNYYIKYMISIEKKKFSVDTDYLQKNIDYEALRINKVYINNNQVLKYNEIDLPFKYTIPLSCLHFIYKIDSDYSSKEERDYSVLYVINNIKNHILLGKCSLNGYYNVSINNNNLMYPDKDSYKTFSNICNNFEINDLNIIYTNEYTSKDTFQYLNLKYYELHNFDKKSFLTKELNNPKYNKINLIPINDFKKLELKTKKCNIINSDKIISKFDKIIKHKEQIINDFSCYIEDKNLNILFNDYIHLYEYLNAIKIINHLFILIKLLDDKYKPTNYIEFCSQLKIFNDQYQIKNNKFKYNFEALFELINGYEIYNEQMERYNSIINNYLEYDKDSHEKYYLENKEYNDENTLQILDGDDITFQSGGSKCRKTIEHKYISYPLHHLMMGKGKSAVLTPLLSLYFSLIYNKKIIIVVPYHLEDDTKIILNQFTHVFNILNLDVFSDYKMKENFLEGKYDNIDENNNNIMLIDEFDYLLDPLKSNFNITYNKKETIMDIYDKIKPLDDIKSLENNIEYIKDINQNTKITVEMKNDILKIIDQIEEGKLVENINWGIHPNDFYAIPYRSKGNPLLNSNFSSCIMTIYLTLYYYIVIHEYNINNFVFNCIKDLNLYDDIFNEEEPVNYDIHFIINKVSKADFDFIKNTLFRIVFNNIFEGIKIANYQYNCSFVDIINIDGLFKIGYSGTINVDFPPIKSIYNFDKINKDEDEEINVHHAIKNSTPFFYEDKNVGNFIDMSVDITKYHAIIDTIGLLKNYNNIDIAQKIFDLL
jgi:hypothetical protein